MIVIPQKELEKACNRKSALLVEKNTLAWCRTANSLLSKLSANNKDDIQAKLENTQKYLEEAQKRALQLAEIRQVPIELPEEKEAELEDPSYINALELFCKHFGNDAEDALIHYILKRVEEFGRIPNKIEIFGKKDPCTQCQAKLQWLADLLPNKILAFLKDEGSSGDTHRLQICYYSDKNFEGKHCVVSAIPLPRYNTRKNSNEYDKLKVFMFEQGQGCHSWIVNLNAIGQYFHHQGGCAGYARFSQNWGQR